MANSLLTKLRAIMTTDSNGSEAVSVIGLSKTDAGENGKSWESAMRRSINSGNKLQVITKAGA